MRSNIQITGVWIRENREYRRNVSSKKSRTFSRIKGHEKAQHKANWGSKFQNTRDNEKIYVFKREKIDQ